MDEKFIWLIAAFALFIFEILTPGIFFFACLGVGALGAFFVSLVVGNNLAIWATFFAVSVLSIYFIRPVAKKYINLRKGGDEKKSNIDALIGRHTLLIEKSSPLDGKMGLVKIDGEYWKVSSEDVLTEGENVEVVAVEGTHLVVRKVFGKNN